MRLFVAALVLAVAVSTAVGFNGYRASKTELVCAYGQFPGETCAEAKRRSSSFTPIGELRGGFVVETRTWKPRWVFPLCLFVGIAGAGLAAGIAWPRGLRVSAGN